ncbi:MAG: sterol desaturase family protein [Polyangiaceae bacterium]
MDENLLSLAVPFFFVSMAAEALVARWQGKKVYRLHDTIASLGCGIGQTLLGFWLNLVLLFLYGALEDHAPFRFSSESPLVWIGSLLAVDFCHYWFHRSSHRVNFLWAGHAVHHQSEEYNLSTALRQSWLEPLMSIPFYLPLALLGVPLEVFMITHTLQTLYQYWVHTRLIRRLGPIDWVFMTPTHHRVHHAINPEYIDKNYAGILVLWDRLFGTFAPEVAEPAYGVVKPLASFDPFYANFAEWARIAALSFASKTTREAWYAPIAPPEWLPRSMGGPKEVPPVSPSRTLFDTRPGWSVDRHVAIHFALVLLATGVVLQFAHQLGPELLLASAAWLMFGLATFGGLMHQRSWARTAERLRIGTAPVLAYLLLGPTGLGVGAAFAALAVWSFPRE